MCLYVNISSEAFLLERTYSRMHIVSAGSAKEDQACPLYCAISKNKVSILSLQ